MNAAPPPHGPGDIPPAEPAAATPLAAMHHSIRAHVRVGVAIVALLVLGAGGWASTAEITGAVIAPGTLVVDSNVKKVQHPTGGIVGELNVRDGDKVKMGDVLVRLDDTVTKANLAIVAKGLDELTARKARLEAERDGAAAPAFPPELLNRMSEPEVARIVDGERKLFDIRRAAREGQKAQLAERIEQLREEIEGNTVQEQAKAREIELVKRELAGATELWTKKLLQITKLTALEREATRLEGERGQLIAANARAKGRISETELQVLQIDRDLSSEVGKDMREIEGKIGEFVERRVAAEDQLKRVDIRAPQDGTVHQSQVHTVGGVIPANAEAIMLVVPAADHLEAEARVPPRSIDRVHLGQTAAIRFSTFDQRSTPEVDGKVTRISADTTTDPRTGESYYTIRIALPDREVARLGDVRLIPGMPVEAFIQTGERRVISYIVKPFTDQLARAFRDR